MAASTLRAATMLTAQHNEAKAQNIDKANAFIQGQAQSYNKYLADRAAQCKTLAEPPPPPPRRKVLGLF